MNGETGIVEDVKKKHGVIDLAFREYSNGALKRVLIHHKVGIDPKYVDEGFAITSNKSQGSEFDYVIFWMLDSPSAHWTREYPYVAVSRAKARCWIIGDESAFLKMCSKRARPRDTLLHHFLKDWNVEAKQLEDQDCAVDFLRNFDHLELMSGSKLCSPTPTNPKKLLMAHALH